MQSRGQTAGPQLDATPFRLVRECRASNRRRRPLELIGAGREDAVRGIRLAFQQAMRTRFTSTVEAATGRKVVAYMSQVHMDPDVSSELFIVEPRDTGEGPVERIEEGQL